MHEADTSSSSEVTLLQLRILNLELIVCELLTKNEHLRLVLSQSIQAPLASDREHLRTHEAGRALAGQPVKPHAKKVFAFGLILALTLPTPANNRR